MENKLERSLLVVSALLVLAGIVGFYYFSEQLGLVRVTILLAATGLSVFVFMQTDTGKETWRYLHEAQIEVRKVVWPTRQETLQTTILVVFIVFIVAIMLWIIDWGVGKIVSRILGYGG